MRLRLKDMHLVKFGVGGEGVMQNPAAIAKPKSGGEEREGDIKAAIAFVISPPSLRPRVLPSDLHETFCNLANITLSSGTQRVLA